MKVTRTLLGAVAALGALCGATIKPAHAQLDVIIDINKIKCIDENDSLTNDEPYVIIVPFFVDGSTVKVGKLTNGGFAALPSSTVTVKKVYKTQDNIKNGDDWCDEGDNGKWYNIPSKTGEFQHRMEPISPEVTGPFSKKLPIAGVVIAVVEEDGSPVQAANAARDAIAETLKKELQLAVFQQKFDADAIQKRVTKEAKNAAISATVQNLSLAGIVDPDDMMGADVDTWGYEQLEQAGSGGIPIKMRFKADNGEYEIQGKVSARTAQVPVPDKVTLKVEKVSAVGDFGESPDFYAKIKIDGSEKRTSTVDDKSMIEPNNWAHTVKVSPGDEVPIVLTLMESDTLKDDVVDINPNKSTGAINVPLSNLPLIFNRRTGEIFHVDPQGGERKKLGMAGQKLVMKGKGQGETAEITFIITAHN